MPADRHLLEGTGHQRRQIREPARPDLGSGSPATGAPLDLAQYERLIDDGLASADSYGGAVDHVTARRLAIWLASRPQQPDFTRGLVHFARTGAISHALKTQLRARARAASYQNQPQASRLMQYCVSRGTDLGPVGTNFASICDQVDRPT